MRMRETRRTSDARDSLAYPPTLARASLFCSVVYLLAKLEMQSKLLYVAQIFSQFLEKKRMRCQIVPQRLKPSVEDSLMSYMSAMLTSFLEERNLYLAKPDKLDCPD